MENQEKDFQPAIKAGLEIHITLKSKKKSFNLNELFDDREKQENEIEAWELGYLGTLPVINKEVIELASKTCIILNAEISKNVEFDRKIYNYFDLPKGFQITQERNPIGKNGFLPVLVNNEIKEIPIERIQIEEDTAKSFYNDSEIELDFNRSGNPLIEIVTKPAFKDTKTIIAFVKQLQNILKIFEISEAKMEKGQLRIDLNFSLKFSDWYQTPRYEVKNLNSLKNLKLSLDQEINKHRKFFNKKIEVDLNSKTLGFDEKKQKTFIQRDKKKYFYLPEINIPTIKIDRNKIEEIKKNIPSLPWEIWNELESSQKKEGIFLFEKPQLIKLIHALKRKGSEYQTDFNELVNFFLNHLSKFEKEGLIKVDDKSIDSIWKLFKCWKDKIISKEEVKNLLLLDEKNINQFLEEKFKIKEVNQKNFNKKSIEEAIISILENTEVNQKTLSDYKKLTNFLFGKLKEKFQIESSDFKSVSEISKKISEKYIKN